MPAPLSPLAKQASRQAAQTHTHKRGDTPRASVGVRRRQKRRSRSRSRRSRSRVAGRRAKGRATGKMKAAT